MASALLLIGDAAIGPGSSIPLEEDVIVIGRDPGCRVALTEMTVSRKHARLSRRPDGHYLEDLASTAGTRINGRPVTAPERLRGGDVVTFGECSLTYVESGIRSDGCVSSEDVILQERDSSETIEHGLIGVLPERKLAAILGLARSLGGGLDLDEVLGNVLDVLFGIFRGAERGIVLLDGGDGPRPVAARSRDGCERHLGVSRTVYEHVAQGGKAILVQDMRGDDRFSGSRSVDDAKIRTLMAVPLRDYAKRVVGLLQLDTGEPRAGFEAADLDLLTAVAVHVGLALDNARLLDASRRESRRLSLLAAASEAFAASLDLDAMLGSLARLCVPLLGDLCVIDVLGEDGVVRRVAAAHVDPASQPLADRLLDYPPDPSSMHPAMRAMRGGRLEMSTEVQEAETRSTVRDAKYLALVRRLTCKSHLCVPMVAHGRTRGVISFVGTRSSRKHEHSDLSLAEELARRAAAAAENARLYQEMERARRSAEDASRAKDRLLATLSHELRTPLTPVLLTLSALVDDPGTPDVIRQQLEEGRRGVELEARLIDDLLDATRAGTGKLRLERRPIDAHSVVREALATCGEVIRLAGVRLDLDLAARRRFLDADPARLQQVVWNLVKNSAKFTPSGGTITVRSREVVACECQGDDGACLLIEVSDTGAGIEAGLLGSIFEPFEQGSAARGEQSGGLGLGLAIARGIAEAHGGRLTASSAGKGFGATFTLELPLSAGLIALAEDPPNAPAARVEEGVRRIGGPLRILLVEDDGPTRTVLSRLLILQGNLVATAATLAAARAAIEREPFDLVICDLGLPDGSGLEFGNWLSLRSRIPALALSGYGSQEDRNRSRDAGFSAHLTKPVNFRVLEETIRRIGLIEKSIP